MKIYAKNKYSCFQLHNILLGSSFHEYIINAYKSETFQIRNRKTEVNASCIFMLTYNVAIEYYIKTCN
jgi:hypothetical protein